MIFHEVWNKNNIFLIHLIFLTYGILYLHPVITYFVFLWTFNFFFFKDLLQIYFESIKIMQLNHIKLYQILFSRIKT